MNSKKSQPSNNHQQPKKPGNQLRTVAALSGLAFQMAIITGLGAYGGYKIDEHYQNETPVFTIILTFIGFGIAMYLVVKQANKLTNQNNNDPT